MMSFSSFTTRVFSIFNFSVYGQSYIYLALIIGAIWMRWYLPGEYPFGFDQVQIAENSQKIYSGDLVLIGPRTGPASMFTGPLIYYMAAPFQAFFSDPYAVVAAALVSSTLTGLCVFILSRAYLDKKTALIYFGLWAISPLIVWFDRVPWNPNLTILAATLSFLPLFAKKFSWVEALLLSIGVFLGYQAHFSGLLLLPLVAVSLVYLLRKKIFTFFWSALIPVGFFVSLLPTIVFDYRHSWLNTAGFISLLSSKDAVSNYWYISRFAQKLFIVFETVGKVLIAESVQRAHVTLGVFFIASYLLLIYQKKVSRNYHLPLIWSLLVSIVFAFYRPSTPEYYFFVLIPAFLLVISMLLSQVSSRWLLGIGSLFFVYALWGFSATIQPNKGFRIEEQLKTAAFIQSIGQGSGLKEVVYDLAPIEAEGVKYLLSLKPFQFDSDGAVVHIQYPHHNSLLESEKYADDVAVWIDSRIGSNQQHLITDRFIVMYPPSTTIYETHLADEKQTAEIGYIVFFHDQKIASLHFYDKLKSGDTFVKVKQQYLSSDIAPSAVNGWETTDGKHYFQENKQFGIVLTHLTDPIINVSELITIQVEN